MTTPPQPGPEPRRSPARVAVATAWLRVLVPTGFTALARAEFEEIVRGLVDTMADVLAAEPFTPAAAAPAGAALVRLNFTDAQSLRVSVRSLAGGLVDLATEAGVADPAGRALDVLGAFTAGYTAELREWLFDQQEEVKQALARATGEVERRLRRSEAWFREVFVRAGVGIAISDPGGKLTQVNPALAEILGVPTDELVGRSLEEFFHPQDAPELKLDYHELAGLGGRPLRRRRRLVRPDGTIVWAYLAVSVLRDTDEMPTLHLTMIENVSDLHLLQDLTSHQALHDVLTGLPNRQFLFSQLQSQLAGHGGDGRVTLYHLDIDGFATVNDGLGPEQGDQILVIVARRLDSLFAGQRALVARLGSDEFAVLVAAGSAPATVLETVRRINEQLAEPVHLAGGGIGLSASIGVAHGVVGAVGPAELMRQADVTLRRARAVGNRQWAEYDRHRDGADRRGLTLAATLSGALEFGELAKRWQPWTIFGGGGMFGVSLQVRWEHPEYGRVDHRECLELAERTGAALPLGAWLIDAACRRARAWRDRFGAGVPSIGVGLTAHHIADPDLVGTVRAALDRAGVEPGALCVGVPARALAAGDGEARENVVLLSGMGVGVVLCDVGVAPGWLSVLDEVPVVAVQFAEQLVREVAERGPHSVAARASAALVGTLRDAGLAVLVPAVGTASQGEWWRAAGALAAAGPHFGGQRTVEQLGRELADLVGPQL